MEFTRSLVILAALCGLVPVPAAFADSAVTAFAFLSGTQGNQTDSRNDSNDFSVDGPGTSLTSAAVGNSGSAQAGLANAWAFAAEGTLQATVSADAAVWGTHYSAINTLATAQASWSDVLTVGAGPALAGRPGTVVALLEISGDFGGGIGRYGPLDDPSADTLVRVQGTGLAAGDISTWPSILAGSCQGWQLCGREYAGYWVGFNGGAGGYGQERRSNIPATVEVRIPVVFGAPGNLSYTLGLEARPRATTGGTGAGTSANSGADYGGAVRWAGITGVLDEGGAAVTAYTVAAESGYDYRQAGVTAVPDRPAAAAAIRSVQPNPFNPLTTVHFGVERDGPVSLAVYSVRGERVRTLVAGVLPAGSHAVDWDGRDESGRRAAGGVYIVRIEADGRADERKVALLK